MSGPYCSATSAVIGLDAAVCLDALRFHRQLELDAVAGLPLARDHGIALLNVRRDRLAVDGKTLQSADRGVSV